MSKMFLPVLLALTVLISGCVSQQGIPTTQAGNVVRRDVSSVFGPQPGEKAPDFTATTIDGRTLSLIELTSYKKPVVLYFFATWCSTCILDLRQAKQIYPEYKDKIEFVAMDLDAEEDAKTIEEFVKRYGFESLKNFALANEKTLVDYRLTQTSTKYLISRDGTVVFSHSGATNTDGWKKIFDSLLQ